MTHQISMKYFSVAFGRKKTEARQTSRIFKTLKMSPSISFFTPPFTSTEEVNLFVVKTKKPKRSETKKNCLKKRQQQQRGKYCRAFRHFAAIHKTALSVCDTTERE
jgi:hypothetical protein